MTSVRQVGHGSLIVLLLILVTAGCGRWVKPGATADEFARDRYECRRDASYTAVETVPPKPSVYLPGTVTYQSPPPAVVQSPQATLRTTREVDETLFTECMSAKGWRLEFGK